MCGVAIERRNIGMVFQHYSLFPHMTVSKNVGFGLEMRRRPRLEIGRKVEEALALVDLTGYGERMPSELSGGQQQRVALARALIIDPSILLMDEPLGALDPMLRRSIQLQLKTLHRALGLTIIYVTHDQAEALHLSDRIVIMNAGRIVQEGAPQDVYSSPRNAFVARFLGECNIFRDNGGCEYAVRPEDVTITKVVPRDPVDGCSTAVVEAVMFLGSGQRVIARSGTQQVTAYVSGIRRGNEYRPGDTICYSFDDASAHRLDSNG
jgi:putative spermidine/putrescine transport system ATP-binding protein